MSTLVCFWKIARKGEAIVCPYTEMMSIRGRIPQTNYELIDALMQCGADTIMLDNEVIEQSETVHAFCELKQRDCCMALLTTPNKAAMISKLSHNGLALVKPTPSNERIYKVLSDYKDSMTASVTSSVYFIS